MSRARIARIGLVTAVVVTLLAGPPSPAHAGGAGHLFHRLNRARVTAGVPALQKNTVLTRVARRHSKQMARTHRLKRPSPSRVPLAEHSYVAHIGVGPSARIVARAIMRGPERRTSLIHSRWTDIGVGVARDHRGRRWATLIVADPEASEWEVRSTRPEPPPPPPGEMIPASIPADCSRDVTSDLGAWIASVPDGSTLIFQRHGCYRVERTIEVRDRTDLNLFGNGAYFKRFASSPPELQYPNANAHWRFVGGSDITVQWMGVEGTNTVADQRPEFGSYLVNFEFEHAFAFHGVDGVRVEQAWADAVWGDGILLSGGDQYAPDGNRNVTITGFVVDRNGRQGVALSNVDGALLQGIEIWHSRRSGFDLEPPPGSVRNVEIRDSYTNTLGLAFASAGVGDVSNIHIHHNRVNGASVPWVYVKDSSGGRRHSWSVHDNVVLQALGSPMAMLYFVNVDDIDVTQNVSHSGTADVYSRLGVEFKASGGTISVVGNDFSGACSVYRKDAATSSVHDAGNVVSAC
jgi:hypothetical protein